MTIHDIYNLQLQAEQKRDQARGVLRSLDKIVIIAKAFPELIEGPQGDALRMAVEAMDNNYLKSFYRKYETLAKFKLIIKPNKENKE